MPIRGEDMARVRLERAKFDAADERNRLCAIISGLEQENAKLRELCASLFRLANNVCLSGVRHCDDCPMSRSEPPCVLSLDFTAMREIGIDVTPWDVEGVEVPS